MFELALCLWMHCFAGLSYFHHEYLVVSFCSLAIISCFWENTFTITRMSFLWLFYATREFFFHYSIETFFWEKLNSWSLTWGGSASYNDWQNVITTYQRSLIPILQPRSNYGSWKLWKLNDVPSAKPWVHRRIRTTINEVASVQKYHDTIGYV